MSYPRNAANPERVSIGPVVQISDGAVQTSGVAVKVIPFGASEASGTGTVAYSADGVVLYTPVQAETNYTSFVLVASKSGCIPASTTVITSASATAGKVVVSGLDADSVTSSALATSAVTEIQSGLATAADQTLIKAKTDQLTFTTANKVDSTAVLDSAAINAVADQVWDEATSGHTTAGTYGGRIVRATNSNTEVQITGSNHIAADVHEFQAGVITAGDFAANSLTASALATDAVTEIQSGLATAAALAAAKTILDKVDTGLVIDGAVYQFTANMLELGPSGGGGGSGTGARTVTITVNDGTTVLQNAVVRFTEGSNTFRALTNASGVAVFNLDDATYTVAITKSGYTYAGTAMIVNGTETATYSMTAVSVTPGSGDLTTGYLTCLDELGAAEANVSVRCQLVQIPSSGTGFAYDSTVQVETSAANGLVEFPMVKGCRYLIWRGSIKPPAGIVPLLISASAGSTTALGSLIGD